MTEIPAVWLWITGIAAVIMMIAFTALCVSVIGLVKLIKDMQPQITGLMTKVNDDLVPQVQGLVGKVETLTAKVDGIADNAKHITDSAKTTVDRFSGKANNVASTLEQVANAGIQKFQGAAPLMGLVLTGLRLWTLYQEHKGSKPGKVHIEKKKGSISVDVEPGVANTTPELVQS